MERVLKTPRLCLRAPLGADAPWVFERWAGQPERLAFLDWAPHRDVTQTRQWLEWDQACWFKKTGFSWLLLPEGEAHPVGQVQLLSQRRDGRLACVLAQPNRQVAPVDAWLYAAWCQADGAR